MTQLVTAASVPSFVAKEAGGKGASLCKLARAGFPVPSFAVLPASAFTRFVAHNGLAAVVAGAVDDAGAAAARAAIAGAAMPRDIEEAVRAQAASFHGARFAVRSSALDEDGAAASFAGAHDTFLDVADADSAVACVKKCWASAFSERAVSYRRERGLAPAQAMAVVLQEMVPADASAVIFTCDPLSGAADVVVMNAAAGLGDALVSGAVDADMITLAKPNRAVITRRIAGARPALDDATLLHAVELALRIEVLAGRPQDVELAVKDGAVWVLQARDVTTVGGGGRLQLWDNSNIVESYGGLTLPLTFDFARYVYGQVYAQFCEILLVPAEQRAGLERYLRNMLGIVNGRVYYNILNWYRLTSILPGFKHNRKFMEQMMGTHHALGDALAEEVRALAPRGTPWARVKSRVSRALVGAKFAWSHLTIGKLVDDFLANFEERYGAYRAMDWSRLDASAILEHWYELERTLLKKWQAPIINDYLCMVHFGVLRALCKAWLPQFGEGFVGELMSGVGDLLSAAPAKELAAIAGDLRADPEARALIERTPDHECLEALRRAEKGELLVRVQTFIADYGHRCMDEMKLEAIDLFEDPSFAFACIKNLLAVSARADDDGGRARREKAEATAFAALPAHKRAVLRWSLKHARRAVRNREATRLCRTRIYGVARAMMSAVGADLARRGIVREPRDVFWLRLDEVFGALDGTLAVPSHERDVALRKAEYARYAALPAPPPRLETRGFVYDPARPAFAEVGAVMVADGAAAVGATLLRGTPCAPGDVEGVVRVVRGPADAAGIAGEILVAERTDPGWIPLYPSVKGLLVERGGLLSHSAIVARESGLPTIVGVDGLCATLKSGMRVRFSGATGVIEIVDEAGARPAEPAPLQHPPGGTAPLQHPPGGTAPLQHPPGGTAAFAAVLRARDAGPGGRVARGVQ